MSKITRDMAYIVGFWLGGGTLNKDNSGTIIVNKKDKYLLKKICKVFDDSNIRYFLTSTYPDRVTFFFNKDEQFLEELDGIFNDWNANGDFLRGVFDSCADVKQVRGGRMNIVFYFDDIKGTTLIQNNLSAIVKCGKGSINAKDSSLHFNTKDSYTIAQFMYKNNPELFLLRKKNKFINL